MENRKQTYRDKLENIFMPHKKDWVKIEKELITMENICIPIRAIAVLKIQEKKPLGILSYILYFVGGCVFNSMDERMPVATLLGSAFIFIGILGGILEILRYVFSQHQLQLRLVSGEVYCFYNRKLKFLRDMMEILSRSLAGIKQVVNINVKQTIIDNQEGVLDMSYHYNPNIVSGKGGNSVLVQGDGNQTMTVGAGSVTGDNSLQGHKTQVVTKSILSEEEWTILETYFKQRCQEIGSTNAHYRECARMYQYVQRRDAQGLKIFMKQLGKDVLRFVLGQGIGRTVIKLLDRVLKS